MAEKRRVIPLDRRTGNRIYDILIEDCGAPASAGDGYHRDRWTFVNWYTSRTRGEEFLIEGAGANSKLFVQPVRGARFATMVWVHDGGAGAQERAANANRRIAGLFTHEMTVRFPTVRRTGRNMRERFRGLS